VTYQQNFVCLCGNFIVLEGCGDQNHSFPGHGADRAHEDGSKYNVYANMYEAWEFYRTQGENANIYAEWQKQNVTLYPNGTMLPGISTTGDEFKLKIKHVLLDSDVLASDGTFNGSVVVAKFIPTADKMAGYETTNHSKLYDIAVKWHEFKLNDCKIPGVGSGK
jgi:hypothetical protein